MPPVKRASAPTIAMLPWIGPSARGTPLVAFNMFELIGCQLSSGVHV